MNDEERKRVLDALTSGEWVETKAVCDALNITFAQGMKMFSFSREVKWSRPPANGQNITTKFRVRRESYEN